MLGLYVQQVLYHEVQDQVAQMNRVGSYACVALMEP